MDPKHILMFLGIQYLLDRGGRTTIHREVLTGGRTLRDWVNDVTVIDQRAESNHLTIVVKDNESPR